MVWTSGRIPFPFQGVSGRTNHQTLYMQHLQAGHSPEENTFSPWRFYTHELQPWEMSAACFLPGSFSQALPVQDMPPGAGRKSAQWASQKHSESDPPPSYSGAQFWSLSPAGVNQHHSSSVAESGAWPPSPLQGAGASLISSDRISALVTSVFLSQSRRFAFISTLLHPADPGHDLKTPSREWQDLTVKWEHTLGAKSLLLCHMSNLDTRTHLGRPAHGWARSTSCVLWQQQDTPWPLSDCPLCTSQRELSNGSCKVPSAGVSPVQTFPHFQAAPSLLECFLSQQTSLLVHLHHTEQLQQLSLSGRCPAQAPFLPPGSCHLLDLGMGEAAMEGIISEDNYRKITEL